MVQRWKLRLSLGKNLSKISDNSWDPTPVHTSADETLVLHMGKLRPRKESDLLKITQGADGRTRSGRDTRSPSNLRTPPSFRRGLRVTPSLPEGVGWTKTPPRADRSPGLCHSAVRVAAPTPPEPCGSGGAARPGPAPPSGVYPRGLVAHLASRSRRQRQERPAGRPHSLRTECAPADRLAGCHTAGPPSARYTPSRARPARVRHYGIPRPGTQPHPANGPDWFTAQPTGGFGAFHWPE